MMFSLVGGRASVEIDGIYYDYNSSTQKAGVTYKSMTYDSRGKPIYESDYSGQIVIPSSIVISGITYTVDYINSHAFYNCRELTSVTIPYSITRIGELAFYDCTNLKVVDIIDLNAWCNISFEGNYSNPLHNSHHLFLNSKEIINLVIPNGVTSIKKFAFDGCDALTSVTIPSSVTSINDAAFSDCSGLTSLSIPDGVTSLGNSAFSGCSNLLKVTIPPSVEFIGSYAFYKCNNLSEVHISDIAKWCTITFGDGANNLFYSHQLFLNETKITNLIIPNGVTTISDYAFSGCSGLNSVIIPNSMNSIGNSAFAGCSGLTSVTFPSNMNSIGKSAFEECGSLTSIIIPNGVTSINDCAFQNCSGLASVTISNSVTSIGNSAFSGCSSLASITIPNSVTSIESAAFANCSKASILKLPNIIRVIQRKTFWGCSSLKSVIIPESVEVIYQEAFANCWALKNVKSLPTTPPFLYDNSFSNYIIPLYVPEEAIEAYQTTSPWSNFAQIGKLDGTIVEKEQCSKPTIAYQNGELTFNCDTENVEFIYQISNPDVRQDKGAEVSLNSTYTVNVHATRDGYLDSDVATATFSWKGIEPLIDGEVAKYRLSFIADNKELSVMNVEYGATITPPTTDNEGNTVKWYYYPTTMPAHDLVVYGITAKQEAKKYTLSYYIDNAIYRSYKYEEGETIPTETSPYKEGYTFSGWQNVPSTMPGYDISFNGTYSVDKYRLSFIVDNVELEAKSVEFGSKITAPKTDNKGNTVTWYTYPSTMPAHDLTVYGMVVKTPEPEVFVWLTVNDCQSGYMKIKVKQGVEQTLNFTAEEGWKISNIFMDGRYVTSRLQEDGTFVTPAINSDASIIIVYEEETPSEVKAAQSRADVKVIDDGVIISNAGPDSHCVIYQTGGKQVVNTVINEGTRKITLQQGQVYILTIDGRTLKFAL